MKFLQGSILLMILVMLSGCDRKPSNYKEEITCLTMLDMKKRFDMFALDNGVHPTTKEGFMALLENPNHVKYKNYPKKPYLKKRALDFWKTPYVYKNIDGKIDIISYGSDKKVGGGDDLNLEICR